MRIYLAGRYSRREELCRYRDQIQASGHIVKACWLEGNHQLSNEGTPIGEHGESLVEGGAQSPDAAALRLKFAQEDFRDVLAADLVISFTEPPRSNTSRGGRHVEFGVGLASGSLIWVIGHRENIFHWLDRVRFFHTWTEALRILRTL